MVCLTIDHQRRDRLHARAFGLGNPIPRLPEMDDLDIEAGSVQPLGDGALAGNANRASRVEKVALMLITELLGVRTHRVRDVTDRAQKSRGLTYGWLQRMAVMSTALRHASYIPSTSCWLCPPLAKNGFMVVVSG